MLGARWTLPNAGVDITGFMARRRAAAVDLAAIRRGGPAVDLVASSRRLILEKVRRPRAMIARDVRAEEEAIDFGRRPRGEAA